MTAQSVLSNDLEVEHRTHRSLRTAFVYNVIKHTLRGKLAKPSQHQSFGSPELDPHPSVYKDCNVQHRVIQELNVYDISLKSSLVSTTESSSEHGAQHGAPPTDTLNGGAPDANLPSENGLKQSHNGVLQRRRLYYFAGGGWQIPASSEHWKFCRFLARELSKKRVRTVVTLVSYPLAPNCPAPIALPWLVEFYRSILPSASTLLSDANREEIILAGDSSGGNIALALTLHALSSAADVRAPDKLLLISPSVDLRRTNPAMSDVQPHDPVLTVPFVISTAKAWCGEGYDLASPQISPLFADVQILRTHNVKVFGVVGGYDILGPDCVELRKKLQQAGVAGKWLEWDKQMHCFPLAFSYKVLPESTDAARWIVQTLEN